MYDVFCFEGLTRWPSGKYGLPMAANGCPPDPSIAWKTGTLYQDCEDTNPDTHHSAQFHLKGFVRNGDVQRSFCMKTNTTDDSQRSMWPLGKYCVYHTGILCPSGMKLGWVTWDDENPTIGGNRNHHSGTLPSGTYNEDT